MNREQTEKLNQLEELIESRIPFSRTHIEEDSYEMMLKLIDEIKNAKDYRQMALSFVGMNLDDFFCNGFFGSDTYDLEGAEITGIYQNEDGDIIIEVRKRNSQYDYGYFEDGWADWQAVYEYLDEWVNGKEY